MAFFFPFPRMSCRINIRLWKSDKIESCNGLFNPEAAHDYDKGMIHRSYSRSFLPKNYGQGMRCQYYDYIRFS